MGTDHQAGERLPPQTACPTSLAKPTLRRQTPEAGAVCLNWARTDLCGGRAVMHVPTATAARNVGDLPDNAVRGEHPGSSPGQALTMRGDGVCQARSYAGALSRTRGTHAMLAPLMAASRRLDGTSIKRFTKAMSARISPIAYHY